jgi:hypothetical protein
VAGNTVSAVNQHLKRIFADNEQEPGATFKKYLIIQTEGGREVRREVDHYNLLPNKVAMAETFIRHE